MLRRLIFFGFGVFISIMFLSMGPENRLKNTFYAYVDYFNINKRVINHLISDSTIISDKVNCKMLEYNLSKDDMLSVLNNGKVNFDKSQTIKSPCQIFYIENQESLKNWIDNDELAIWSTDVVNELRDYVSDDKGKTNASKGSTDDTVMSLAIAAEVYRTHINRLSTSRVGFDSVYIPERQTNWI